MDISLMKLLKNAKSVILNANPANIMKTTARNALKTEAMLQPAIAFPDFTKNQKINLANNAHGNAQNAQATQITAALALVTESQQPATALTAHTNKLETQFVQIALGNAKPVNSIKTNVLNAEATELIPLTVSALKELSNQI